MKGQTLQGVLCCVNNCSTSFHAVDGLSIVPVVTASLTKSLTHPLSTVVSYKLSYFKPELVHVCNNPNVSESSGYFIYTMP